MVYSFHKKKVNKEYVISFTEDVIRNPKYEGWTMGRMEIWKIGESGYPISEIRFFTLFNEEWVKFEDEYEGKEVTEVEINDIIKIVKKKFYNEI